MTWVLGDEGDTADLTRPGAIAEWLAGPESGDRSPERDRVRRESAYGRFSWDILADRYAEMLRAAATSSVS
jgi:glycosyltransferase involved in cell wall biosynthesis